MRRVNLSVELLQNSNLDIPFKAGLMCTNNFDKSNDFEKNKFLLNMVNEKHYSVIELKGMSEPLPSKDFKIIINNKL